MKIKELFKIMIEKEASDLFLRTNSVPRARIDGIVKPIHEETIPLEDMNKIADELLENDRRKEKFYQDLDIDFAHYEEEVGRFRINIFMQRGTPAIVARHVKSQVKNFKELNLPDKLLNLFCEESNGLVLLTGPAGSGKTTTIASMLQHINETQEKHIATVGPARIHP